jgi:hypothetical protein
VIAPGTLTLSAPSLVVAGLAVWAASEPSQSGGEGVFFFGLVAGQASLTVLVGLLTSALGAGWVLGCGVLCLAVVSLLFATSANAMLTAGAFPLRVSPL